MNPTQVVSGFLSFTLAKVWNWTNST